MAKAQAKKSESKTDERKVIYLSEAVYMLVTDGGSVLFNGNPNTDLEYHIGDYNSILFGHQPYCRWRKDKELMRVMREWNKRTKPKRKDTDHTFKVHPVKVNVALLCHEPKKKESKTND